MDLLFDSIVLFTDAAFDVQMAYGCFPKHLPTKELHARVGEHVKLGQDYLSKHSTQLKQDLSTLQNASRSSEEARAARERLVPKVHQEIAPRAYDLQLDDDAVSRKLKKLERIKERDGGLSLSKQADHKTLSEQQQALRIPLAEFRRLERGVAHLGLRTPRQKVQAFASDILRSSYRSVLNHRMKYYLGVPAVAITLLALIGFFRPNKHAVH